MNVTLVGPNAFINNKCYMITGGHLEHLFHILTVPLVIAISIHRKARLPCPAGKEKACTHQMGAVNETVTVLDLNYIYEIKRARTSSNFFRIFLGTRYA